MVTLRKPLIDSEEGYEEDANPHEISISSAGFYPQDISSASEDMNAGMFRDSSGNLVLKDANSGQHTLSSLLSGGGGSSGTIVSPLVVDSQQAGGTSTISPPTSSKQNLYILAGSDSSGGTGGTLLLKGGTSPSGNGGSTTVSGGEGYAGGGLSLVGGYGYESGGGNLYISGGQGNNNYPSGSVTVATTNSGGQSGSITIRSGQSNGSNDAGGVTIKAGAANGSGHGGSVLIDAAYGGSGSGSIEIGHNDYCSSIRLSKTSGSAVIVGNMLRIAGDLEEIKGTEYSWPSANSAGVLCNNGSGSLSWSQTPYSPSQSANWDGNPSTVAEAINRLAAAFKSITGNPVP